MEGDRLTGAGCMRCLLGAPERDSGMVLELLLVESKGGEILGERELSSSLDLAGQHGQRRCDARPERCSAGSACLLGHGGDYVISAHPGHSGNQAAQTARRSHFSDSVCCSKAFDKCAGTSVRHRAPRRRLCGQFEHEDLLGWPNGGASYAEPPRAPPGKAAGQPQRAPDPQDAASSRSSTKTLRASTNVSAQKDGISMHRLDAPATAAAGSATSTSRGQVAALRAQASPMTKTAAELYVRSDAGAGISPA